MHLIKVLVLTAALAGFGAVAPVAYAAKSENGTTTAATAKAKKKAVNKKVAIKKKATTKKVAKAPKASPPSDVHAAPGNPPASTSN